MNQLRQLRALPVNQELTDRVLLKAKGVLTRQERYPPRTHERLFAILVAAVSLAHAVWTVVFMNNLAR
jgi:hypothetical protein